MALRELINADDVKNGIVFCNRKSEVDVVAKSLKVHGIDAAPIHGDLDQSLRMKTLADFRSGALRILVGSDVAARGLDIPDVSHVFNYDVPHHADDYVHRIGRTGRAGKTGKTYMIITPADAKSLDKVMKLTGDNPVEIKLDLDWSIAEGDTARRKEREKERGGGRERSGGRSRSGGDRERKRDYAPKPDHQRAAQPMEPAKAVEAVEASEQAVAPEPRAPRPERARNDRPRGDKPLNDKPRSEGSRSEGPRSEAPRGEPRSERPRQEPVRATTARPDMPQREDGDDKKVVGFGNDLPAFLKR